MQLYSKRGEIIINIPKSTKLLIGTVIILGSLLLVAFLAQLPNDPENEIETYLKDSPLTENKINDINTIEDEDERLNALEGNLQTASRTISVADEDNVLGKNMLTSVPTDEELKGTILFITFDKTIEDVDKEREKIVKYSEDDDSLAIKVIYLNVEASYISGSSLINTLTDSEGFKTPPAAFVVKNGDIVWQDTVYDDLPYRGDVL